MTTLTKVIRSGNSQAIRIPASMRLDAKTVEIAETPSGLMIIDPARLPYLQRALRGIKAPVRRRRRAAP